MNENYVSPEMEVFSFTSPEAVMDVGCPTYTCTADGICVVELDLPSCITDTSCILDGVCVTDGMSGI